MDNSPPTKKSLGQHWLTDASSLEAICLAAELSATETVLEVGPGPGSLTKLLCARASKVIAVELDAKLADQLKKRLKNSDNLEIVNEDIMRFDLSNLPLKYKLVANIPYYLTSHLIRDISESSNPPELAVLLIQKEVAERINAKPGQMSLLSVSSQFYWQVSLGPVVPPQLFTPPPKVDSQVVILKRRAQLLFKDVEPKAYFRIVKAGFSQKRKTLLNSLSASLRLEKEMVEKACLSVNIDPKRRPQTLSLEEWYNLYRSLSQ
jgi:16S rRNA (adenine1518-N6/adenine1519-N6)-dimethyltransferase